MDSEQRKGRGFGVRKYDTPHPGGGPTLGGVRSNVESVLHKIESVECRIEIKRVSIHQSRAYQTLYIESYRIHLGAQVYSRGLPWSCRYFRSAWNLFDFALVVLTAVDVWVINLIVLMNPVDDSEMDADEIEQSEGALGGVLGTLVRVLGARTALLDARHFGTL